MMTTRQRIPVNPGSADAFGERFRTRAGLADQRPGFIGNEVLRPIPPGKPYIVLVSWASQQEFENWTTSDAFKQGHARSGGLPSETFNGHSEGEVHELFLNSAGGKPA